MNKVIQIYKAIKLQSIVYETGDLDATINCELEFEQKTISSQLIISHTDLNRLISKIDRNNNDWLDKNKEVLFLEDGSQLIEYNFKNNINNTIHNFHFNNTYAQIGA